jgi:hypothetical protein
VEAENKDKDMNLARYFVLGPAIPATLQGSPIGEIWIGICGRVLFMVA